MLSDVVYRRWSTVSLGHLSVALSEHSSIVLSEHSSTALSQRWSTVSLGHLSMLLFVERKSKETLNHGRIVFVRLTTRISSQSESLNTSIVSVADE